MSDTKNKGNEKPTIDQVLQAAQSPTGFQNSDLVKSISPSQILNEGVDLTFTYHNDGKDTDGNKA